MGWTKDNRLDLGSLRRAVSTLIETYNNDWLIEHLGHRIPREAVIEATLILVAKATYWWPCEATPPSPTHSAGSLGGVRVDQ
jgi:hypothetical protein